MLETAEEIFNAIEFVKILKNYGIFEEVIEDLENQEDDNQRVLFLEKLLKEFDFIPVFSPNQCSKNEESSKKFQELGNGRYVEGDFKDALKHYNAR